MNGTGPKGSFSESPNVHRKKRDGKKKWWDGGTVVSDNNSPEEGYGRAMFVWPVTIILHLHRACDVRTRTC